MYFGVLHQRLVEHIQCVVRSGRLTERRLARLTGVSQPHLHNVLKGTRLLSPQMADQVLQQLRMTVYDLPGSREPDVAGIPVLRGTLGPGLDLPGGVESRVTLPITFVAREPALMRLGRDPASEPLYQAGDWVLVDRAEAMRLRPDPEAHYAVSAPGGPGIRRVARDGESLLLGGPGRNPAPAITVSLREKNILDIVRARVLWLGRCVEPSRSAAGPSKETG